MFFFFYICSSAANNTISYQQLLKNKFRIETKHYSNEKNPSLKVSLQVSFQCNLKSIFKAYAVNIFRTLDQTRNLIH